MAYLNKNEDWNRLGMRILIGGLIFGFCVFSLFPFYWMVSTSLTVASNLFNFPPKFFPNPVSFGGYLDIFFQKPLLNWLLNSVIVSILSTLVALVSGTLAGYSFSRFKFAGRKAMLFVILLTQMIPMTLLLLPIFIMFGKFGLVNTFSGLILAYTSFSVPITAWMMKGFFDGIPFELEEAAFIDGCSRMKALGRVIIPLTKPGLISTSMYTFIISWKEFLYALTLAPSESKRLVSVGIYTFIGEYVIPWDQVMAAGVIISIPVFVLFFFMQKHLVGGLTAGAVKG